MSTPSPHVLVVEDEAPIREGLMDLLTAHGFEVTAAGDGASATQLWNAHSYALIVLDVMIPAPSGLELLRAARARNDRTPVLMLTARGAEDDVVAGLEAGADDYVTKPFGVKELVARIRGLLRRSSETTPSPRRVSLGDAVLDLDNARIDWGVGEKLELTAREALLLGYLWQHRARIVPRAELLVHVWGYRDGSIETRTVDVHVQKLRSKLRVLPQGERLIETSRGLGYRLGVAP